MPFDECFMSINRKVLSAFGLKVRELRNKQGLSQEALAAKCNLDRTYISGVERGKRNISLMNIHLIADSLGVSVSFLFEK